MLAAIHAACGSSTEKWTVFFCTLLRTWLVGMSQSFAAVPAVAFHRTQFKSAASQNRTRALLRLVKEVNLFNRLLCHCVLVNNLALKRGSRGDEFIQMPPVCDEFKHHVATFGYTVVDHLDYPVPVSWVWIN